MGARTQRTPASDACVTPPNEIPESIGWGDSDVTAAVGCLPRSQQVLLDERYVEDAALKDIAERSETTFSAVCSVSRQRIGRRLTSWRPSEVGTGLPRSAHAELEDGLGGSEQGRKRGPVAEPGSDIRDR